MKHFFKIIIFTTRYFTKKNRQFDDLSVIGFLSIIVLLNIISILNFTTDLFNLKKHSISNSTFILPIIAYLVLFYFIVGGTKTVKKIETELLHDYNIQKKLYILITLGYFIFSIAFTIISIYF